MTTPFLKPCPFCGEPIGEDNIYAAKDTWHVACPKCRTRGPACNTGEEAVAAWNERKEPMGEWVAGLDIYTYAEHRIISFRVPKVVHAAMILGMHVENLPSVSRFIELAIRRRLDQLGIGIPASSNTGPVSSCSVCGHKIPDIAKTASGYILTCPECHRIVVFSKNISDAIADWNRLNANVETTEDAE